jgi:hypothetical protein
MTINKKCPKCGLIKDRQSEFCQTSGRTASYCYGCAAEIQREYKSSEKGRLQIKKWIASGRREVATRKYYAKNKIKINEKRMSNYYESEKVKYFAHKEVFRALRDNKLTKRNSCEICLSNKNIIGHHHDYTEPLDIVWLCKVCHSLLHKKINYQIQNHG